jgi:putative glutamine amidotransferase
MHPPLIGVTTSEVRRVAHSDPLPQGDPPQAEMALGMLYARAVELAGGLPVVLPPLRTVAADALVDRLAGLCLSGGPDLDPAAYGADPHPELGPVEPALDSFELSVARRAAAAGIPILGICRGCQTLNVAHGGSLHQQLPDVTDGSIDHRQTVLGSETTHGVRIDPDSRLAAITGPEPLAVNSFHHQAVDRLGDGLRAVAWSPDGVVEAIEAIEAIAAERFLLGVQWHAESLVGDPRHLALFEALVAAASGLGLERAA